MEGAASAEKRSVEDFRVRVHGGPHPLRAGSEGAATTFGRDDDAGWAPPPPDDANASRRIVAHFDVDAFYSQVEELRDPRLRGRPMAVTQKNTKQAMIKGLSSRLAELLRCSGAGCVYSSLLSTGCPTAIIRTRYTIPAIPATTSASRQPR